MKRTAIAVILVASLGWMGCGDDDDNGDNGGEHADLDGGVEVLDAEGQLLAQWDRDEGWRDEGDGSIDELPVELEAGGEPVELEVVMYDRLGAIEMDVESVLDEETGELECGEWSNRYFPVDADLETDVIAWPGETGAMAHPDSQLGAEAPNHFAERSGGEVVQLFGCDRVWIYPEEAGELDMEFHLWHLDHSDGGTRPITLVVD